MAEATDAGERVVDELRAAADGTRQTARWIASAFAAIPALGVLAALIRAPGDKGFDPVPLFFGVAAAATGAALGIFAISRVLAPVPLSEGDLLDSTDLRRIPGHPYTTYGSVREELRALRAVAGPKSVEVEDAAADADQAKAVAAEAEAQAAKAEEAASKTGADDETKRRAFILRDGANALKTEAAKLTAVASYREASLTSLQQQIDAREHIRVEALRLLASEQVLSTFRDTKERAAIAVGLVALGVFLLAIAPRTAAVEVGPDLVTLTLTDTGREVLDCPADTLQAFRIGGDDTAPKVVTLPTVDCPSQVVEFRISEDAPLGELEEAKAVTPPPASSP